MHFALVFKVINFFLWVSNTKRTEKNKIFFQIHIIMFSSSYKIHERARGLNDKKKREHEQTSNFTRNNCILTVCNVELKDSSHPELVTYECKKTTMKKEITTNNKNEMKI